MKAKYFIVALIIVLISIKKSNAQQNIQLTQYIFNSISVNPAYAGYKEEWFSQLALRSQWAGLSGAPKTGQLSIDGILDPQTRRMGAGLQLTADKSGAQSALTAYANYAYRLRLNDEETRHLSFGIGAGFSQYSIDGKLLKPVEGEDNSLSFGKESALKPDLRFGIYYSSPTWYIGASIMDLLAGDGSNSIFNRENNAFTIANKRHFYLITGTLITLDSELKLRPSLIVKEDFKGPTSLDLNTMFIFADKFWIGGGFRTGISLWEKEFILRAGPILCNQSIKSRLFL